MKTTQRKKKKSSDGLNIHFHHSQKNKKKLKNTQNRGPIIKKHTKKKTKRKNQEKSVRLYKKGKNKAKLSGCARYHNLFLLKWEGTIATHTSNIPEIKPKPLLKECELEVSLFMLTTEMKDLKLDALLHHTDE